MGREDTLHTLAVADTADGEGLVQTAAADTDHDTREDLNTLLVALDDLGVHPDAVAHVEFRGFLAELLALDFVKQCGLVHGCVLFKFPKLNFPNP